MARQIAQAGLGDAAISDRTRQLHSRLHDTRAVPSVCPHIADTGRGYLLTVGKRLASHRQLERWRDSGTRVRVRYSGLPDAGARVERIAAQ